MMSIVHHSNYIRFFEEARCDFMEQIGCDVRALEDKGVSIAVVDAYAKYIVPLIRFTSQQNLLRCRQQKWNLNTKSDLLIPIFSQQ